MKNRLPFMLLMLLVPISLTAQPGVHTLPLGTLDTVRIASYNLLDYPGTDYSTRDPYFRRVIHSMKPDVLVVQEMTSQTGVNTFLSDVLNIYQPGLYSTIAFHNGYDTDNHIFYKSGKVSFVSASYIPTALRDIAEYVVQVTSSGEQIRLYSVHLKASQGYENDRLAEATILRNYLNTLPPGTKFIIVGDYNVYTSTEPGFQKLIDSEANNNGRAKDPINAVGNWHANASFAAIHTQSPRVRQFGGGSNGGMDDRFDIMLTSFSALDGNIILSRYTAYGNDAQHFNDSINRLPNYAVPDSVANGLHYASDHLPVFCDYTFGQVLGAFALLAPANGAPSQPASGTLRWGSSRNATGYDVYLSPDNPPLSKLSSSQADTTYSYSALSPGTLYYWKVVARNAADSVVATGSPWQFTTLGPPPGAFLLASPPAGATGQPASGTLSWHSSSGATGYDLYLDVSTPPGARLDSNLTDTSRAYTNLSAGVTYYWKVVAENSNGSTDASDAPRSFTIANIPAGPSHLHIQNLTSTGLGLAWTDNATNELGYRVYRSVSAGGPFPQVGGDLPPSTVSFTDTGLSVNQRYFYRVAPFNGDGAGDFAAIDVATLAQVPGIPALGAVDYISLTLTVNPAANPPSTQYAIRTVRDTVQRFVGADGMLLGVDAVPVWRTYAEWGGASGVHVTGLEACSLFTFSVEARNADSLGTAFGPGRTQQLPCFAVSTTVASGWNLVSVPVMVGDFRKTVIFPSGISDAFTFQGSYISQDTLQQGAGYWLKFPAPAFLALSGEPSVKDSIRVITGWNLIGSLADSIDVASVTTDPPGVISQNSFFGFNGMYVQVDSILPMHGYWVKATDTGKVVLTSVRGKSVPAGIFRESDRSLNTFTFEDAAHHRQTLFIGTPGGHPDIVPGKYELPPLPPEPCFDVRFADNTFVQMLSAEGREFTVLMHGAVPPVTVSWKRGGQTQVEFLLDDRKTVQRFSPEGGTVLLSQAAGRLFLRTAGGTTQGGPALPGEFALHQNYPNPFNPSTEIRYELPGTSRVKLGIYNLLGAEVSSLVNGVQEGGVRSVRWQPDLPSGVYLCRLEAAILEDPSRAAQLTIRLLLMK